MKELSLLVWLTQLGLSVAIPPVILILGACWLHNTCGWGNWIIWVAIVLSFILAIDGLRVSLKAMSRLSNGNKKDTQPPVSFNDHA